MVALVVLQVGSADFASAATTHRLVLGPAQFQPADHTNTWGNLGSRLQGKGSFVAPAPIPVGATVTGFTLYALDDDPIFDISAVLSVPKPRTGAEVFVALVTSTGQSSTAPRSFSASVIVNPSIGAGVAPYVSVVIGDETPSLRLYGVRIRYTLP